MKTTDYLLNALQSEGIDHLFLVPGGHIDPFISAFKAFPNIKPIVACHEEGAGFMADGYARVSGKFGVAMCIGGPGITNMTTAIANAYTDRIPLFVITGETKTYFSGRGAFQDSSSNGINDATILQSITSKKFTLENPKALKPNLNFLLRQMFGHATCGPVHLSIPSDLQTQDCNFDYEPLPESFHQIRFLDAAASQKTWDYFHGAKKIAILAGTGLMNPTASAALIKFAERFEIPVATTLTAKGVFPEDHRLSLGVFGWYGNRHAIEALLDKELDVLIVLGSRLHFADTMAWTQDLHPKTLIINDVNEAAEYGNYQADLYVVGHGSEYLNALIHADETLQQILQDTQTERSSWLQTLQSKSKYYDLENCSSDQLPLHPARVATELRNVMPRNTILFDGEGASNFITAHYWDCYQPNQFFTPVKYLSPMGWSLAAAIGAKFARPDVPVVCVIGDGSMLMHGLEIQTAARNNLPIIIVVMNNGAHGNPQLRAQQIGEFETQFLKLPFHDWAAIANSLGALGMSIDKPEQLTSAFKKALELNKTVVIDVRVGNYKTPTYTFDKYIQKNTDLL